jgi:putative FmdB family regulatory protein
MPTYQLQCQSCQDTQEVFLKSLELYPTECAICKEPSVKQIFNSAPAIKFNGKGWTGQEIKLDNLTRKALES